MTPFHVILEIRSSLGTPLAADTLWGHIAWGIRHRVGNADLESWLAQYNDSLPPLIISDPMPRGFFPRPHLPQKPRPSRPPSRDEMMSFKQNSKEKWVSRQCWDDVAGQLEELSLSEGIRKQSANSIKPHEISITHAGVNRLTGGTAQIDGGTLYSTNESFFPVGSQFEIWGLSSESIELVQKWFEWGLEGGYGRDAATGRGHIQVVKVRQREHFDLADANAVMLLGSAIPAPQDPYRGFFRTYVKSGRVGGDFAIGSMPDGSEQRQKFPVTMLQAGSILLTEEPVKSFGRVISGVHQWDQIRQYGIAPTIPVKLTGEILSHKLLQSESRFEESNN